MEPGWRLPGSPGGSPVPKRPHGWACGPGSRGGWRVGVGDRRGPEPGRGCPARSNGGGILPAGRARSGGHDRREPRSRQVAGSRHFGSFSGRFPVTLARTVYNHYCRCHVRAPSSRGRPFHNSRHTPATSRSFESRSPRSLRLRGGSYHKCSTIMLLRCPRGIRRPRLRGAGQRPELADPAVRRGTVRPARPHHPGPKRGAPACRTGVLGVPSRETRAGFPGPERGIGGAGGRRRGRGRVRIAGSPAPRRV